MGCSFQAGITQGLSEVPMSQSVASFENLPYADLLHQDFSTCAGGPYGAGVRQL